MYKMFLLFFLLIIHLPVQNGLCQAWKVYPYFPDGTTLSFPDDEGWHSEEPVEWWYTIGHVTGLTTGSDYSYLLVYFYYPKSSYSGIRIFTMSNHTSGQFFQDMKPYKIITLEQDFLHLITSVGYTWQGVHTEEWATLRDAHDNLIPFNYSIQAELASGSLDLLYDAVKPPLLIGDTGFVYQGPGLVHSVVQTLIKNSKNSR